MQQAFTNKLSYYVIPVSPADMLLFLVRTCVGSENYSLRQGDVTLSAECFLWLVLKGRMDAQEWSYSIAATFMLFRPVAR
jgi:hypothetical protein